MLYCFSCITEKNQVRKRLNSSLKFLNLAGMGMLFREQILRVKEHEIYIKIRIYKKENGKYGAKCMSFHIADRPVEYPFKKRSTE